jgi:hypothetical protein
MSLVTKVMNPMSTVTTISRDPLKIVEDDKLFSAFMFRWRRHMAMANYRKDDGEIRRCGREMSTFIGTIADNLPALSPQGKKRFQDWFED